MVGIAGRIEISKASNDVKTNTFEGKRELNLRFRRNYKTTDMDRGNKDFLGVVKLRTCV